MHGKIAAAALLFGSGLLAANAATLAKAEICHYDELGVVNVLEVSASAVPAHLANHGDHYVGAYFADLDGDGFGAAAESVRACAAPAGYVENALDCDDANPTVHPGAPDVCDDVADNDCSGAVDPNEADDDGDGVAECAGDCNDADPNNGGCCENFPGPGCFWMENYSGQWCFVPASDWAPTFETCQSLDSCGAGGGGASGGGCYKWADCSNCAAVPWP